MAAILLPLYLSHWQKQCCFYGRRYLKNWQVMSNIIRTYFWAINQHNPGVYDGPFNQNEHRKRLSAKYKHSILIYRVRKPNPCRRSALLTHTDQIKNYMPLTGSAPEFSASQLLKIKQGPRLKYGPPKRAYVYSLRPCLLLKLFMRAPRKLKIAPQGFKTANIQVDIL